MILRLLVAALAVIAICLGAWRLLGAADGLDVTRVSVGDVPVTVFQPASGGAGGTVVIAHGFAGSQQMMQPFALTLARNGMIAVTFDFPGHGRNPEPLPGGLTDERARSRALVGTLDQVVAFARTLQGAKGIGLLGHSMGSDIVVREARARPDIVATVAVSTFAPSVTPDSPRNLLVIVGGLEPAMIRDAGAAIVAQASGGPVEPRTTYGSFADGTARRLSLSGGVEHIGVLYSRQSMEEALAWFDQAFGRRGSGWVDERGPWLGVLFAGLVALAWPLSWLLPRVAPAPVGSGLAWARLLTASVIPAVLTPLLLWKLPTNFLPILLGDYLAAHFALYGVLTAVCLWAVRRPGAATPVSWGALAVAAAAAAIYSVAAIGLPIDRFITSYVPIPARIPLVFAMLCGTLPYAVADEWLTRGPGARRGGYALTKVCFLVSLVFAVALNLPRLFFLIIIIPAILAFFLVFGLISTWAYRRAWHPLVGAAATAAAFAWGIAVVFPLVSR